MNREEIIRMAREAGFRVDWQHADVAEIKAKRYEYFAALVAAAEREKVARWHIGSGYATGHGDTIEDLLVELEWQVRESEREACAKVLFDYAERDDLSDSDESLLKHLFELIRARGQA
jgi:hypothetical protein